MGLDNVFVRLVDRLIDWLIDRDWWSLLRKPCSVNSIDWLIEVTYHINEYLFCRLIDWLDRSSIFLPYFGRSFFEQVFEFGMLQCTHCATVIFRDILCANYFDRWSFVLQIRRNTESLHSSHGGLQILPKAAAAKLHLRPANNHRLRHTTGPAWNKKGNVSVGGSGRSWGKSNTRRSSATDPRCDGGYLSAGNVRRRSRKQISGQF